MDVGRGGLKNSELQNIKIILQYDGSRYDGWQKQGNTGNTIQSKLEAVLFKLAGQAVEVFGSGRTDAGVHALGQAANFYLPMEAERNGRLEPVTPEYVKWYLNHYLPEDIAVLGAQVAPERFHSRLWAVEKTYVYQVETSRKKNVFERKYIYGLGRKLDVERMRQAAALLLGTHDFLGFSSVKKQKKSTVRTLREVKIEKQGSRVTFTYTGDGFLYNMVRILTGTLIEVGLGERLPGQAADAFDTLDRQSAGFTAPPEGLFLAHVSYERGKNFNNMQ